MEQRLKCLEAECSQPAQRRGMCINHYAVWYRAQKKAGVVLETRKHQIVLDCNPDSWTREKAWLCGAMLGDGSVLAEKRVTKNGNRRTPGVSFVSADIDLVTNVRNLISPSVPIASEEGKHSFSIGSIEVATYFHSVLKISGKKMPDTPYPVIPDEFKSDFFRGLWDTDGHIGNDRPFFAVIITNVVRGISEDLWRILRLKEGDDFSVSEMESTHHKRLRIRANNKLASCRLLDYMYLDSQEKIRCQRKYDEYRGFLVSSWSNPSISSDRKCLVCGSDDVFARSLCREHYVSSSWKSKFNVNIEQFKSAYNNLSFREIDWAMKQIVLSFLSARFDMQASPEEAIDVQGVLVSPRNTISKLRGYNSRTKPASWLSFGVPYHILSRENISGKKVFDPFAGWGTRLLACCRLGASYEAFDVNSSLIKELDFVVNALSLDAKIHHRSSGIRTNFDDISDFDYTFTSPPYWIKEIYSNDPGQAQFYGNYDNWMQSCIFPCFEEVLKRIRVKGIVMVKNVYVDGNVFYMADDLQKFFDSAGCETIRYVAQHGNHNIEQAKKEAEVCIEFSKPKHSPIFHIATVMPSSESKEFVSEYAQKMLDSTPFTGLGRPRAEIPCRICGSLDIHEMSFCKKHFNRYCYLKRHERVINPDDFIDKIKSGVINERDRSGVRPVSGELGIRIETNGNFRVHVNGKSYGVFASMEEAKQKRDEVTQADSEVSQKPK